MYSIVLINMLKIKNSLEIEYTNDEYSNIF